MTRLDQRRGSCAVRDRSALLRGRRFISAGVVIALAACAGVPLVRTPPSPGQAADELIGVDRMYSEAAAKTTLVPGLSAMFADDVFLPTTGESGRDKAIASLVRDTLNARSTTSWIPIRVGVSADGTHGFTYGYMTTVRADGSQVPMKYLAYWVRGAAGWKVLAYRRTRRPPGVVSTARLPPILPDAIAPVDTDSGRIRIHEASLVAAESDFSQDAQRVGLRAAFTSHGSADAMNIGGPTDTTFVIGAANIGVGMGPATTSPVSWSATRVIVATSGDLGLSIGAIRSNAASANGAANPPINFFTVWRRRSVREAWRYIAE